MAKKIESKQEENPPENKLVEVINKEPIFTEDYKKKIEDLIEQQILGPDKSKLISVKAHGITSGHTLPTKYLLYLSDKASWCFSQVLIKVTSDDKLEVIDKNYEAREWPEIELLLTQSFHENDDPDPETVEFFVGTPADNVPSAVAAVLEIAKAAKAAGLTVKTAIGKEAVVSLYKLMFCSKLKAVVNIGHGNTEGILLYDGKLSYDWFNSLEAHTLSPEVIYLNSCQTYNNPLFKSVVTHDSRTYIAGIINLAMVISEGLTTNFWQAVLSPTNPVKMLDEMNAINATYKTKVQTDKSAFGLSGDSGKFMTNEAVSIPEKKTEKS